LDRFDLVITTPQYRLADAPNVLHNQLPVHDATPQRLASEAARWEAKLAAIPRPFTGVLVGGSSGPYLFTPEAARRLGREASALPKADRCWSPPAPAPARPPPPRWSLQSAFHAFSIAGKRMRRTIPFTRSSASPAASSSRQTRSR
jgi:hypothetical protein